MRETIQPGGFRQFLTDVATNKQVQSLYTPDSVLNASHQHREQLILLLDEMIPEEGILSSVMYSIIMILNQSPDASELIRNALKEDVKKETLYIDLLKYVALFFKSSRYGCFESLKYIVNANKKQINHWLDIRMPHLMKVMDMGIVLPDGTIEPEFYNFFKKELDALKR